MRKDLDIHVPGDLRGFEVSPDISIYNWEEIVVIMNSCGYTLVDLHEHKFAKSWTCYRLFPLYH